MHDWLLKYTWLVYSSTLEGVICRFCVIFGRVLSSDRARTALGQLVATPLRSLKDTTSLLRAHQTMNYHLDSVSRANEFLSRYSDPSEDIDRLMHRSDERQPMENRTILVSIARCLLFLAQQNLALRGADDDGLPDENNRSQENFCSSVQFHIEAGDLALKKHIDRGPKNAMYL